MVATLISVLASAAYAQSTAEGDPGQAGADNVLEEIVVTSRRREESLQTVPISVAALSSADLESRNVTNLLELNTFIPNVVVAGSTSQGAERGSFGIRGLAATRNGITDEPRVAVYLDGVFLGSADGALLDVVNIARLEVLRGPQGTLFGKNALAGAISYVSERPSREFGGQIELTYGRFDRVIARGQLDIPLSDTVSSRFSIASKHRGGYVDSVTTGAEYHDDNRQVAVADILWEPTDRFTGRLVADFTRIDNKGVSVETVDTDPFPSIPGIPFLVSLFNARTPFTIDNSLLTADFKNRSTSNTLFEQDAGGVRLHVDWALTDGVSLKAISAYREFDLERYSDLDGLEFVLFEEEGFRTQESFQQELQLSGNGFADRLKWVAGAFYFTQELDETRTRFLAAEAGLPPAGPDTVRRETDSFALFAEGTYSLTDIFDVTLGLRWTTEDIFDFGMEVGTAPGQNESTFEEVSPRVSLTAAISDEIMAFLSYSEGFRSGGHNNGVFPNLPDNGFIPFDPETLSSFEIGLKSQFFENRLRVNGAVFFQDHEDIQIPQVPPGETENFITNAGDGEIDGFEVDASALIGRNWTLNAAVGHLDPRYTRLEPGVEVSLDTPYERAPEWSYSLGLQFDREVNSLRGALTARIDYGWQDDQRHNAADDLALEQEAYGLLSARLTLSPFSRNWSASLYGTNLTDERYILSGIRGGGATVASAVYGPPAQWGITFDAEF